MEVSVRARVLEPTIRVIPRIIAFLGYDPEPEPSDLSGCMAYARRCLGFTQADLARALNVPLIRIRERETGRSKLSEIKRAEMRHPLDEAQTGFSL